MVITRSNWKGCERRRERKEREKKKVMTNGGMNERRVSLSFFLTSKRERKEEQLYRAQSKLWFMFDICLSGKRELFSVGKRKKNEIESG